MKFKISGSDKKSKKNKAVTFGYKKYETDSVEEFVKYINTHATLPCSVKKGHRLRDNVEEIYNWIRLDCDVKSEAKNIEKKLRKKDVYFIKKPSTSNDGVNKTWKWHFFIPTKNISTSYDAYKLQYYKFLADHGIELSDKSLASVVQNTNPNPSGIKRTVIHKGDVWEAPNLKAPKRKALKHKKSNTSIREVKKALSELDPNMIYHDAGSDKVSWLKVGMALYDFSPKKGFDLFDEWSKGGDKYDGTTQDKWDDFQRGTLKDGVSLGSLFYWAFGDKEEPSEAFGKEKGSVYNLSKKEKKKKVKERKNNPKPTPSVKKPKKYDKNGIDWDAVNKIKKEVMKVKGGFELINNEGNWAFMDEGKIWDGINGTFDNPFNMNVITKMKEEIAKLTKVKVNKDGGVTSDNDDPKKLEKAEKLTDRIEEIEDGFKSMRKTILKHIRLYNQYETKHIEIDPFKNETCIKMVGADVHVTLCDIFHGVDIKKPKHNTKPYLKDFKKHFSHFDEFMELIIASRFASNRKKAYLHTKMISDFGKSFLGGVFSQLGLLVEMDMGEMRKAVRGEPSGVNPKDFISAWILQFDEVKYIPAEIKKIYNEITIAAKGQQRMSVPTYMKWLSSAEDIQGMKGVGADKQIANRLSAWNMGDKTLDSRKLFAADNAKYFTSLKWEIYMIIKKAVADRIEMGKAESYQKSQKFITKFHKKYGIEATLDHTVNEFMEDLKEHVIKIAKTRNRDTFTGVDKLIAKDFDIVDGELVAYRTGKFDNIFTTLAKEHYGADYKALEYKSGLFREMFGIQSTFKNKRVYRLN